MDDAECPVCYQEPGTYSVGDCTEFFSAHDDLDGKICDGSDMPVPDDEDED